MLFFYFKKATFVVKTEWIKVSKSIVDRWTYLRNNKEKVYSYSNIHMSQILIENIQSTVYIFV